MKKLDTDAGNAPFGRDMGGLTPTVFPPEGFRSPEQLSGLPCFTPLLIGFSGGVDSSVLLFLIARYAKMHGAPLRLVHVHHGIRGEEADRDADFAQKTADAYGLPLSLIYKDVPASAKFHGESLETAARRERYEAFSDVMREFGIPILLTAHNADDQLETVLFRLLRGSGLSGLCGIPPVRPLSYGKVVRPLLSVSKEAIEAFAATHEIPFVYDSTNDDVTYTRNRIRRELVPLLREISPNPERSVARMTDAVRRDKDYLDSLAEALLRDAESEHGLDRAVLRSAPEAVALRTLHLYWKGTLPAPGDYAAIHLESLLAFARHGRNGSHLSLPKSVAVLERGILRIVPTAEYEQADCPPADFTRPLLFGETHFPELGITAFLGTPKEAKNFFSKNPATKVEESAKNIYNSSTQIIIGFDTINRSYQNHQLLLRPRLPGDRIFSHGMHRSLRTLANEAHLTAAERSRIAVITDQDGEILWIPGLAIRDGIPTEAGDRSEGETAVLILSALPFPERQKRTPKEKQSRQ